MNNQYKNDEGYADITEGKAIREVDRPPKNVTAAIWHMKEVAEWFGCRVTGRIRITDEKTGKEYR